MAKKPPKQPPNITKITKTLDETYVSKRPRKDAKLKEEVWQIEDGQVVKYSLAYINPSICAFDGCLDTTTATAAATGISWEQLSL